MCFKSFGVIVLPNKIGATLKYAATHWPPVVNLAWELSQIVKKQAYECAQVSFMKCLYQSQLHHRPDQVLMNLAAENNCSLNTMDLIFYSVSHYEVILMCIFIFNTLPHSDVKRVRKHVCKEITAVVNSANVKNQSLRPAGFKHLIYTSFTSTLINSSAARCK